MTSTSTVATGTRTAELPEVADPSRVAPKDARELSKLFFHQLAVLEEACTSTSTPATR